MSWFPESQDRLPLTWWKGQPVFLAAILALAGLGSMVVTALLMALMPSAVNLLVFSYGSLFGRGWFWTPVTYVLVNPPSIWLVLTAYLFWRFGEEVERHLGRRVFVQLLLALLLITPVLLSVGGLLGAGAGSTAGMAPIGFGLFLAFATLYPRAKISLLICNVDAWILAAIFVGVGALGAMAERDGVGLLVLAGQVLVAHGYTRYEQGLWTLPKFLKRAKRPATAGKKKSNVIRGSSAAWAKTPPPPPDLDVDAILEKIHRSGLQSLTAAEKSALEQASQGLRQKRP